jgi:hypothetical protein
MIKNKEKIINSIQKVRGKNNKYWMDLMRLAFKYAPKEASKTIKKINILDKKISSLVAKLAK